MVSLFTFYWNGVTNANYNPNDWFSDSSLRVPHAAFNDAFVRAFPKELYTTPFTNYTDASNFGVGSQLTGTGETIGDVAGVKAWIIEEAGYAGIAGNPQNLNVSLRSIEQLQQGQQLDNTPGTVNPLATTDGANQAIQDLINNLPDAPTLGISTGVIIAIGVGLFLITRK